MSGRRQDRESLRPVANSESASDGRRSGAPGISAERYYAHPDVRRRLIEFLGGETPDDASARFITADGKTQALRRPRNPTELSSALAEGLEISRSLWDRRSLLAHLDVEYVNFDWPGEAYLNPERIFDLQAPVVRAADRLLQQAGIFPLHILSGRGHHLVWQIPIGSPPFKTLVEIGSGPPSALQIEAHQRAFGGDELPGELIAAFAGLALVIELLGHEIKEAAAPRTKIPVELTAVEVGPAFRDREMISIDLSEYGDPLHTRTTRVPFSLYLKPWQQRYLVGDNVLRSLPPIFFVPLADLDVRDGIEVMRDAARTTELASRTSVRIPDQIHGMENLIARYVASPLRRFHDWYYSHRHDPPEAWPDTYDRTPLDSLPCCARRILECPNDLLLRPSGMRLVTRAMLALGWHPRHVAGLIRSKFERDFGWGEQWRTCHPAMRADFYTRIFSGLFVTGRDDLWDFNCQSAIEAKICNASGCSGNLEWFQRSALARRRYDHLAHRPFNRLFSPHEHL